MAPKIQNHRTPLREDLSTGGFSLVEVLLAIGIVSFALLVVFSLLPTGLNALQQANRQTVESEIFQTVAAELNSTPFTNVSNFVNGNDRFPIYYDNDGVETEQSKAVFTVRCTLCPTNDLTNSVGDPVLQRATIKVGYQRDPANTNGGVKPSEMAVLLVNRGI